MPFRVIIGVICLSFRVIYYYFKLKCLKHLLTRQSCNRFNSNISQEYPMPNICNALAIPELFFVSGMARGLTLAWLAAGDKMGTY
jgi:hypothetical protein